MDAQVPRETNDAEKVVGLLKLLKLIPALSPKHQLLFLSWQLQHFKIATLKNKIIVTTLFSINKKFNKGSTNSFPYNIYLITMSFLLSSKIPW